ncbi:PREDICTED: putative transcription factor bHLH107 [Ipomoea nil]|uniref:putative transcription factor bHLH107 n=1 Tax=Ipomoea nil TaxID=35883 RepID=UPI000901EE16|nr:PREDICTED: putative transcription factor bHLH107 [Ipomoea nil]
MKMLNSIPLQTQNEVDYHLHHQRRYLAKKKSKEAANRHAKAESERRKRINSHLSTLRKLFPHLTKKDKPRVLTEAVKELKELRQKVAEQLEQHQSEGETPLFLPGENDEVAVVPCDGEGESAVKATICCEDRPGLNRDLTEAVQSVKGRVVRAEMATVGGRTKVDVVVRWCGGGVGEKDLGSLRRALKAVVENRSLGMLLCRRFRADTWAGPKVDGHANNSAQICGSLSNGSGLPDGLLFNTV